MSDKIGAVWLIRELYARRQAGQITDVEARWVLVCTFGEAGLRALAQACQN